MTFKAESILKFFNATVVAVFVYSCFHRGINVDDAWLGEPAMWLAKEGVIRSQALQGWEGAEKHLFFTHKLLVLIGAAFVKILGYGVYQLKAVSVGYLAALLVSWRFFFKRYNTPSFYWWLFACALLINSLIFEYSFIFRPEIALAFYASWAYFFLDYYERKPYSAILAGIAVALAIGHHLNGVIIGGAGALLLLSEKKYKDFLLFSFFAGLGFLFYLIDVRSIADFHQMVAQFSNTQDMRENVTVGSFLFRILDEQRRYLHSPREISMTLFYLVMIGGCLRTLISKDRRLVLFTSAMAVLIAVIAHGKTSKYLIIFSPFLIYLSVLGIREQWERRKPVLIAILSLYVIVQLIYDVQISVDKEKTNSRYSRLAAGLPVGSKILAPMNAVFWAWDKYDLQAVEVYEIYYLRGVLNTEWNNLLPKIEGYGRTAMILPEYMRDIFKVREQAFGPYKYMRQEERLYFYCSVCAPN